MFGGSFNMGQVSAMLKGEGIAKGCLPFKGGGGAHTNVNPL